MTRSLKLLCLPLVLLTCSACLSLDFMFLDAPQVDAYELDPELIPPELVEVVSFDRGDGTQLAGLWARQDATTPSPPLVYFHGTSNHLGTSFPRIAYYWGWGGYDVFAPEYSGFGTSEGEAGWTNLTDLDGHAALTYVS